ncbi:MULTISPECIES: hypothetical protein [Catenuloplanes]|uniref:Uncharacterized protein n=1 Tax=Catenuloplanes niger TaxID=587534 RepID=A0AAE3ZT14_9ACTN|nr:hypothetical protein [Catenuloplanes niger]MDR7325141.1 hypothetical protein [Catenuloplanes niger]
MHSTLAALWMKARQAELLAEAHHTHLATTAARRPRTGSDHAGLHGDTPGHIGGRALRHTADRALRHTAGRALRHTAGRALRHTAGRALRRSTGRALIRFGTLVAGDTPRPARP